MAVDIESLSASEFLMLMAYEGKPPPGEDYDKIRMSQAEWDQAFPAAVEQPVEEVPTDAAVPEATPTPNGS